VILDLPCSGTGTLRRHPELKWRISEGEIGRLRSQALRLLEGGAPLVAPGGVLVAITCSLEREENEDVVARFLAGAAGSGFSPVPLEGVIEPALAGGILGPGGWRVTTGADHDGFTVHVLGKARI
jgi:16S rRNA (cytosine967-C5)-methyltransferase